MVWTIVAVMMILMGGYAITQLGYLEGMLAWNDVNEVKALNIAEAGLDRALVELGFNASWNAGFSNQPLDTGTFTVTVSGTGTPGQVQLTSTGTVNGYSKTVQMVVDVSEWPAAFTYGMFWGNPTGSTAVLDVENNAEINGSFFANGNITFTYNATLVNGDLYATGTATANNNASFTQGSLPNPLPQQVTLTTTYYTNLIAEAGEEPSGNWSVTNNNTYNLNGQTLMVNGAVTIGNNATVNGPGTIVATGNITIDNNAALLSAGINLISGATLSLSNNVDYVGQGNTLFGLSAVSMDSNSSASSDLYLLSPGTVTVSNNGSVRGVIWAGTATFDNNAEVKGAVYAQQFNTISNNFLFTEDSSVLNTAPPQGISGSVQVLSWQENAGVW
jgi:hypothetical protein